MYLIIHSYCFQQKKSVLLKLPHLIILLPRLDRSNEIHFSTSHWGHSLLKEALCSSGISLNQLPATGLLADRLKHIFDGSGERGNTAMKLFPYCSHFQITAVGTNTIFNLSFSTIKLVVNGPSNFYWVTYKGCYEDPGNKTERFMKRLVY